MKTTSKRFKAAAPPADQGKAILSLIIGILALAGGAYALYQLIMIYMVFTGGDVMPYVYWSLGFAAAMFIATVGFHYYGALKVDRVIRKAPRMDAGT